MLGLIILGVVSGIVSSFGPDSAGVEGITLGSVAFITAKAFGFLAVSIVPRQNYRSQGFRVFRPDRQEQSRLDHGNSLLFCLRLLLKSFFSRSHSRGAFAAGLVLRETDQFKTIEGGIKPVSHFFAPDIFRDGRSRRGCFCI